MLFLEEISSTSQNGKNIKDARIKLIDPHNWHTTSRRTKEVLGPYKNKALISKFYAISLLCWGMSTPSSQMILGR